MWHATWSVGYTSSLVGIDPDESKYCNPSFALRSHLEAGGDAIIRVGLHANTTWHRYALFAAAAAVILFTYGWTVNAPPWDFGKLLGLYVVFFFIFAQLISWIFFKQAPSLMVLAGGSLIVAGGIVISFAKS